MTPYKADSWWERNVRDKKILQLHDEGLPVWRIAEEMHLSENHITVILKHYQNGGG